MWVGMQKIFADQRSAQVALVSFVWELYEVTCLFD